jgi:cysteine synthase B
MPVGRLCLIDKSYGELEMTTQVTFQETQILTPPAVTGLEGLVGNTPLLQLRKVTAKLSPRVQVFAKAEWFNPGGSIKDRPALNIIRTALSDGRLRPGKRLIDATSGNTGIAYATFGAALDIPVTLALPANASRERLTILETLGVELLLTDPLEGIDGAIRRARQEVAEHPERYFYANQYDNPANWQAHYFSTGPEIVQQTPGHITHFAAGLGTSGTLMGVGRYLKHYNPDIQLIAGQPDGPFHGLEGLKHMASAIRPAIYAEDLADRTVEISTESAYEWVRRLARQEGLFVGISSGANLALALQVAVEIEEGVVVTVFPDAGYKYLSETTVWGG